MMKQLRLYKDFTDKIGFSHFSQLILSFYLLQYITMFINGQPQRQYIHKYQK